MSSRSTAPASGPRVRPVTWAILAWVLIMIAAIVGAWQGSASRHGSVPSITVATDRDHVEVPPFAATDLDGTSYANPVGRFTISGEHTLTVRLPVELRRATLDVYEVRADGFREYTVEPDGPGELLVPVTLPDEGRIEGLALRAVALVYAADGSETILSGEWSVGFDYAD
ncbi:DUF2771 domain-containing protein [Dietzia natronolimnaea]|uniref:DUF2771 domain-containing protein n=1 Tax=Dietzia natronolimnaea TaxID=161920 RepID=A0A2A2WRW8_9ACTN|nr:DUF2771 family protein [Dietzia natronolimnaea]PAY23724.1 DUF2771 domain-containing protein [Dietzia natronolimnaea]